MERYKNLNGDSGIVSFEIRVGEITVQFCDGWNYRYSSASTSLENVQQMQRLAVAGKGLHGFIKREVEDGWIHRWK